MLSSVVVPVCVHTFAPSNSLPLVIPRKNKEEKVFPANKYEEYMKKLCVNIMKDMNKIQST